MFWTLDHSQQEGWRTHLQWTWGPLLCQCLVERVSQVCPVSDNDPWSCHIAEVFAPDCVFYYHLVGTALCSWNIKIIWEFVMTLTLQRWSGKLKSDGFTPSFKRVDCPVLSKSCGLKWQLQTTERSFGIKPLLPSAAAHACLFHLSFGKRVYIYGHMKTASLYISK